MDLILRIREKVVSGRHFNVLNLSGCWLLHFDGLEQEIHNSIVFLALNHRFGIITLCSIGSGNGSIRYHNTLQHRFW